MLSGWDEVRKHNGGMRSRERHRAETMWPPGPCRKLGLGRRLKGRGGKMRRARTREQERRGRRRKRMRVERWLSRWLDIAQWRKQKPPSHTDPPSRLGALAAKKSPLAALASGDERLARYLFAERINLDSRRQET